MTQIRFFNLIQTTQKIREKKSQQKKSWKNIKKLLTRLKTFGILPNAPANEANAFVAQLAERLTRNEQVVRSNRIESSSIYIPL